MSAPPSFRSRLATGMALLATLVLGLCSAATWWGVRHTLQDGRDRALLGVARAEAASAFDSPDGAIHLHGLPSSPGREDARMRHLAQVMDGERVVALGPNLAAPLPTEPDILRAAAAGRTSYRDFEMGGEPFRAVYLPVRAPDGRTLALVAAVSDAPLRQDLGQLLGLITVSLVAACAAAWTLSHGLAGRLTGPLSRMAEAARAMGRDTPGSRLPAEPVDRELAALREALNSTLDDLDRALAEQGRLLEAQRRFTADASHELRTPLTNLAGTLEVSLRRDRPAEEYRAAMATALEEARRMTRLVEDLLTVSRARAGQLGLVRSPVDLAAVARESVQAFLPRAREEGVDLRLDAPGAAPVQADPDRLRQVLDNLLENALRHAGGEVDVRVEARQERVRTAVTDSGPGLDPEERARVFDRFYRADPSRTRTTGGAGLGLAIARTLVEAHGGTLHVDSEPGRGATFWFDLPALVATGSRPGPAARSAGNIPATRSPRVVE